MAAMVSSQRLNPEAQSFFPTTYTKLYEDYHHPLSCIPLHSPTYSINPFKHPQPPLPSLLSLLPPPPALLQPLPPPSCTYTLHLQPIPQKPISLKPLPLPLPLPSPTEKKMIKGPLTPVPAGPRMYKYHVGGRRCSRPVRFRNTPSPGGRCSVLKWVEKGTLTDAGKRTDRNSKISGDFSEARRWKNKFQAYQEIMPLKPEDEATSVMIRNIPNKYNRKLLLQCLDNHCKAENEKLKNDQELNLDDNSLFSAYDFVYLPIDFQRRVNAGFAFVNFTSPIAAARFRDAFDGKRWEFFESPKIAQITKARIQGKEELVENVKRMNFTCGSEEDLPVWFEPARDGSGRQTKMHPVGKSAILAKKP